MRHHDGAQTICDEIAVRLQVVVEVRELAFVHGELRVRVAVRSGMRREMLRRDGHPRLLGARGEPARERRDDGSIAMQRAVADDLRETAVEIDARREAHVDADGAQLGRHEPTAGAGRLQREIAVLVVEPSELAKRRQPEERLAEALHAPAFLIDGHEQRRLTNGMDLGGELRELLDALEVTREQDDAAHERRREPLALVRGKGLAAQIDHQGTQRHDVSAPRLTRCPRPFRLATRSNSSTTSPFAMRMQPIEPGTPSGSVSGVPWM